MNCDIIIPVWNQLDVTRDCIDSVLKHTDYPYRFIIIDNGSEKETEGYLKGLKDISIADIILIRNDRNLGFVKAVNQGIKASDARYLCILNNDTIVTGGWLGEMVRIIETNPAIGLLNPSSNTSGQFSKDQSINDYAASLRRFSGQIQELYTCRGFCMLLKREVIERLGSLDEIYHLGYFDDTDYCKRAQLSGYRTARAKAAYVYHKENTSFKGLEENKALFENNEKIFFSRWGRHLRVAYIVDRITSGDEIDRIAIDAARAGHQIIIFIRKGLDWPVTLDHFDIRRMDINPIFFGMASFYKIMARKKKKGFHVILTDNILFGAFLNMTGIFHGSDVLIGPDKKNLLDILRKKSKVV